MPASCPVCSSHDVSQLDERFEVPVLMNRLYPSREAAMRAPLGPVALRGCGACGFVWNAAFDDGLIIYDADYENDQTHSAAFARHIHERAEDVAQAVPAQEQVSFLEVGCGQGRFIEEVARSAHGRLQSAEGFDPAWRGADGAGPSGSRIHTCYLTPDTVGRLQNAPNVVATRHTIEHVPDPVAFLTTIRNALGPNSKAQIFVETPCVEWILKHEAMQDFFYEHCTLFTAQSLGYALERAGFHAPRVDHVFGGQYLWARAAAAPDNGVAPIALERTANDVTNARGAFAEHWRNHAASNAQHGAVALWGAGAKGVNFALLADPAHEVFDHVVDINPAKQGKYLPGSGLPVISPEASARRNIKTLYVMNPNYLDEIRSIATAANLAANLIPIN